jgi:hypothetical protein
LLSSAILYVAIVAIWAGVLIPRWLRRDSAASERYSEDLTTAETEVEAEVEAEPAPPPRRRDVTPPARREKPTAPRAPARQEARADTRQEARPEARTEARPEARPEVRPEVRPEGRPEIRPEVRAESPGGGLRDGEHKKVLVARQRLLYMLLALAIGSGALAFTKMAAWWVIVPPTIMLLGYIGLLREASKADAERRELERARATAAAAVAVAAVAARRETAPVPAKAPPPPNAEVIDISASLTSAGQEFFDQYADAKLRAVGDLARSLAG